MNEAVERRLVPLFSFLTDALIIWAALNAALYTRVHTLVYMDSLWLLVRDQALCMGLYLAGLVVTRSYHPSRLTDRFDSVYYACLGLAVPAAAVLGIARFLPEKAIAISGRELVLGPFLAMCSLVMWRYYLGGLASRFASLHRVFYVLGEGEDTDRIAAEIASHRDARAIVRRATLDELRAALERSRAAGHPMPFLRNGAIITTTAEHRAAGVEFLEFCKYHFGRTFIYPSLDDMLFFRHGKLLAIGGVPLIEVSNRQLFSPYAYLKRSVDIATAGAGLLLALPLCIVTALAVKFTSPGPIFYSQERMGLNGRRFRIYKFRSMVSGAEDRTGPVWAQANDARVTPVGRFIRKHRIDEVPQLFSVLKGDMSLIGPRPERPVFHEEFCQKWPYFERRLAVRPGVTSLSHVLGSYSSNPDDRLRYDLMYISSLSFMLDVKILVATVRVVLGAKGAQ